MKIGIIGCGGMGTTHYLSLRALAEQEGVRMLFERIEGLVNGEPRDVVVRHELIVRSSVSVPRERYKDS